jgi:hypothetical protein
LFVCCGIMLLRYYKLEYIKMRTIDYKMYCNLANRRYLRMPSSGLYTVALVRADVSEERSASIIRVTRIGELGTTLPVTSNRHTPRRNNMLPSYFFAACRRYVPPKRRLLQEPHVVIYYKTAFLIVTALKTSILQTLFNIV